MIDDSLCPVDWQAYMDSVDQAIAMISNLDKVPEATRDEIIALLEVDRVSGYTDPKVETWEDSRYYAELIVPDSASVPEADRLYRVIEELSCGNSL